MYSSKISCYVDNELCYFMNYETRSYEFMNDWVGLEPEIWACNTWIWGSKQIHEKVFQYYPLRYVHVYLRISILLLSALGSFTGVLFP